MILSMRANWENRITILVISFILFSSGIVGAILPYQTATAHNPGLLEEHCSGPLGFHFAVPNENCRFPTDGCVLPNGRLGIQHFVNIDKDSSHDHTSPGPNGEPLLCLSSLF